MCFRKFAQKMQKLRMNDRCFFIYKFDTYARKKAAGDEDAGKLSLEIAQNLEAFLSENKRFGQPAYLTYKKNKERWMLIPYIKFLNAYSHLSKEEKKKFEEMVCDEEQKTLAISSKMRQSQSY